MSPGWSGAGPWYCPAPTGCRCCMRRARVGGLGGHDRRRPRRATEAAGLAAVVSAGRLRPGQGGQWSTWLVLPGWTCCGPHARMPGSASAAGAGPDLSEQLGCTSMRPLLTAHSPRKAAPMGRKGSGFHPLRCYLDRPDVSGGEALTGLLKSGNAGSNTAADHVEVLDLADRRTTGPSPARRGRQAQG